MVEKALLLVAHVFLVGRGYLGLAFQQCFE